MSLYPGIGEQMSGPSSNRGLYDPRFDHDACGVAFVAQIAGGASHAVVAPGIEALVNLGHRGACGADPDTGDGAGILVQLPDAFLREASGLSLPAAGAYGVGMAFLPTAVRDRSLGPSLALVQAPFSTNVLPRWDLAKPFRMCAHNGEINTLRGNVNWMRARQSKFRSPHFGDDVAKLHPVIDEAGSDSSQFDNALELLATTGRSVEHAVMMMIPEAWHRNPMMDAERRAFYEFHSALLEPWDGPAAIAFTDGRASGATLDRHGLRPPR